MVMPVQVIDNLIKGKTKEEILGDTPLLHGHINPYGLVSLDMEARLMIELLRKTEKQPNLSKTEELEYA